MTWAEVLAAFKMVAEIYLAIKSLGALAGLLRDLTSEVKNLSLTLANSIEQKQIETFKKEVNETLEQIKAAKNDNDRRTLIVELSRRLSK